jgi:hypothetical protein
VGGSAINISLCLAGAPAPRKALPIGFTRPGASRQRPKGLCSLVPNGRGAALYGRPGSAQGRTNRDNIEQALSGRTGTVVTLSSPMEHGPGQIPCAPTSRPGPFSPKTTGRLLPRAAVLDSCGGQHAAPSRLDDLCPVSYRMDTAPDVAA